MLNKKIKLKYIFVGFLSGLISSIVYVFSGGDVWLAIPSWAWVLFWPGFMAGEYSHYFLSDYGLEDISLIIGFLSVAIYYGVFALIIYYIVSAWRKKHNT